MRGHHVLHTTTEIITELTDGAGLGLAAAARRFPSHRTGGTLAGSTVWRWISQGVRMPDGRVLQLEAARVGGRVLTSVAAIRRFVEAQANPAHAAPAPAPRTLRQRRRAADQAAAELDRLGI